MNSKYGELQIFQIRSNLLFLAPSIGNCCNNQCEILHSFTGWQSHTTDLWKVFDTGTPRISKFGQDCGLWPSKDAPIQIKFGNLNAKFPARRWNGVGTGAYEIQNLWYSYPILSVLQRLLVAYDFYSSCNNSKQFICLFIRSTKDRNLKSHNFASNCCRGRWNSTAVIGSRKDMTISSECLWKINISF